MSVASFTSYGKIYNVGHRAVADILSGDVDVEEKIDGSQFSFGSIAGQLMMRSKGRVFAYGEQDKMFDIAAEVVNNMFNSGMLKDGWTYRGEYLRKPCHNALSYERTPKNHIMLFDIAVGEEDYVGRETLEEEAKRLGLEVVPVFYQGYLKSVDTLVAMLDRISVLGGAKIEGVVIKTRGRFCTDGKPMMAKHVTEAFKEVHKKKWGENNQSSKDILQAIGESLRTEARWRKAMQRMRDDSLLTDSPADIGPLIRTVQQDIQDEEVDYIKDRLYAHAKPHILRISTRGLPEFYKTLLLEKQFQPEEVMA